MMFLAPAFINGGMVASPVGAYLGMLVDSYYFRGTIVHDNSSWWKGICRLLVCVCMALPLTLPFFYMKNEEHTVYVLYLVKTALPFFSATFVLFAFGKAVMSRLGLVEEEKPKINTSI